MLIQLEILLEKRNVAMNTLMIMERAKNEHKRVCMWNCCFQFVIKRIF